MAHSRKDEARALNTDEQEIVDRTRHPAIQSLSDAELGDLLKLVRERRDKAQSASNRQRREMRGKSAPRGAQASADNTGTQIKTEVLAMAVRRVNGERERRARIAARDQLAQSARNALAMRGEKGSGRPAGLSSRSRNDGMNANESPRRRKVTSGQKVGSVSQQTKRAQAKRDA